MGIRNLFRLIKEFAPAAVRKIGINELDQKVVAVDASIAVYQWCLAGRARHIVNSAGMFINHIQGAFFRISAMLAAGITPIFVFDGPPPALKERTILQRKSAGGAAIPREVFAEVAKLCALMKVAVIQAPSEAEAQAAHIRGVDIVATEDMDALAFGAKYMLRGLDASGKSLTLIDTSVVLAELGLTREQFVDLCILLGTDYTCTLPRVGYKRALGLIKKHGSIEAIIGTVGAPEDFDYVAARAQFFGPTVDLHTAPDGPRQTIEGSLLDCQRQIDVHALQEFLVNVHGLSAARIRAAMDKLAVK